APAGPRAIGPASSHGRAVSVAIDPSSPRGPASAMAGSSLWRHANFLKLWTAQSISVFGSQISALAIPLVAALVLHVAAFQFALLGTIEFLPFILFTLPAGAWIDRVRRRPILIVGDLGRAIALATIPLAYALGALTIQLLYVVGFVTGTL